MLALAAFPKSRYHSTIRAVALSHWRSAVAPCLFIRKLVRSLKMSVGISSRASDIKQRCCSKHPCALSHHDEDPRPRGHGPRRPERRVRAAEHRLHDRPGRPPLATTLAAKRLLVSWRRRRSLAAGRKRAMWSSVSSVMPSPSSGHGGAGIVRAADERRAGSPAGGQLFKQAPDSLNRWTNSVRR